jgi:hypothetical protein
MYNTRYMSWESCNRTYHIGPITWLSPHISYIVHVLYNFVVYQSKPYVYTLKACITKLIKIWHEVESYAPMPEPGGNQ